MRRTCGIMVGVHAVSGGVYRAISLSRNTPTPLSAPGPFIVAATPVINLLAAAARAVSTSVAGDLRQWAAAEAAGVHSGWAGRRMKRLGNTAAVGLRPGSSAAVRVSALLVPSIGAMPVSFVTRLNAAIACAAGQRLVASILTAPRGVPGGVRSSTGASATMTLMGRCRRDDDGVVMAMRAAVDLTTAGPISLRIGATAAAADTRP